jgi:hypothetical protein
MQLVRSIKMKVESFIVKLLTQEWGSIEITLHYGEEQNITIKVKAIPIRI